jgi:oxygen-independent coproporphyrinogen-3 oxidase
MKAFKEVGITRPTFGIQSFDQKALTVLNRKHNVHQSHKAIYYANVLDFPTFGTDLIFGLPGQNTDRLTKDLEQLIDLEPPHISFYQLTVEEGTPLAWLVNQNKLRLPDNDMMHALYRQGCDKFASAGYTRYEVSSFAKAGHECRHNLGYWTGNDYIGLGPAAHSFINGERFSNRSSLADYLEKLNERKLPREDDVKTESARIAEAIMVGLRMTNGIDRVRFAERYDRPLEDCFDRRQYDLFIESGHLIPDKGNLRLSDSGLDVADEIVRRLVAV